MIIFDLKCSPDGHVFEAWFGSSDDFESQNARGLVGCPVCGSEIVEKAPMAPRVGPKGNQVATGGPPHRDDNETGRRLLAALAAAQREILQKSDFVGDRFPDEARAIHLGEAEARAIHGRASRSEAEKLLDEGIDIAPLPLPIIEPGMEN
jgi:hypothetical protein